MGIVLQLRSGINSPLGKGSGYSRSAANLQSTDRLLKDETNHIVALF